MMFFQKKLNLALGMSKFVVLEMKLQKLQVLQPVAQKNSEVQEEKKRID